MARLIGGIPRNLSYAENVVFSFVMEELPDYITAGFCVAIDKYELDVVLMVPHMGIFILEIKGGTELLYQNNEIYIRYNMNNVRQFQPSQTKRYRYMLIEHMRKNFHINPLVYELNCFPMLNIDEDIRSKVEELEDHFLFQEDFSNARAFLLKLFKYYTGSMNWGTLNERSESNPLFYDDLDDETVYEITRYWGAEPIKRERPAKPPYAFLSYNQNNQNVAKNIQIELERRGVFTWKAPHDVTFGGDYIECELKAIEECDAFILLLSASSQVSEEVKFEFEEAMKKNKKIYPIVLGEFEINSYYKSALKRIEWRVLYDEDWSFLNELVEILMQK